MKYFVTLVGIITLIGFSDAHACDCPPINPRSIDSVSEHLNQVDAVFLARAESVETAERNDDLYLGATIQTTMFDVQKVWKGDVPNRVFTKIDIQCCICGAYFTAGETYLIFARQKESGEYDVSSCSLTMVASRAAETIRLLDELVVRK